MNLAALSMRVLISWNSRQPRANERTDVFLRSADASRAHWIPFADLSNQRAAGECLRVLPADDEEVFYDFSRTREKEKLLSSQINKIVMADLGTRLVSESRGMSQEVSRATFIVRCKRPIESVAENEWFSGEKSNIE